LAHVAWSGVALGFAVGIYPLGTALALTVVGAIGIHLLQDRGLLKSDAALGMVTSIGFAVGLAIVSATGGFNQDLNGYLFGYLLAVTTLDLWVVAATGVGLLILVLLLYKELLYVSFSEEAARLSGLPVHAINILFMALTAATIVVAARIVGLLLVGALLIIPAATALQVARSFRQAMLYATGFGVLSVLLGIWAAVQFDGATGATIVLASGLIFLVVGGGRRVATR
ncbi:MAG: metal ABC transporter permease, partial [Candidatus Thermoplasmatota archaeon]|nr:metal ABC transporter permease [Candidatus Thermoplasmatota archaeon]